MGARVVYQLPRKPKSWVLVGLALLIPGSPAVVLVSASLLDTASYAKLIVGACCALVVALPIHEVLHALLFRLFGATPVRGENQIAVNAPDARLSTVEYLTVLLAPLALIVGSSCVLLQFPTIRMGAAVCITIMSGFSAFDICRAFAVLRGDGAPPWADLPNAVGDWQQQEPP